MTVLGNLVLWLAFLVGVWGALAGLVGGLRARPDLQQSARHAVFVMCGALLVAVFSLEVALFRHDFNVEYVAAYTSRNLPIFYTWSALYAGQKGSLLFWATVLSLFGSLAMLLTARRHHALLPYVAGVVCTVATFFISVMLFGQANPFHRLAYTPLDGNGLNPQLQNPGMVFHPPMLYLGYISITIPFAFAMAALLSKRLDVDWLVAIRKWTLLSWLFLSIGICLGMWWAYVELGWGGYWAWDPVENASLLPWLTMTAFLHSVMIQEKRGMLKKWNLALIIGSWLLSIFGTFITRSGVISSVHSFTQSNVGYFFLFFLIAAGTASFALYATRLPLLDAEARLESMVSREASFLFNNLLLVGIAFSVLWGTLFPILSELVQGTKVTVGPPFFNQVNIPLGLALLALTGIGPLIAWRRASLPNLQRQFAVPVTVGGFAALVLLVGGMRDLYARNCAGCQAHRRPHDPEAQARRWPGPAHVPDLHQSRHPQRSARVPVRRAGRLRQRDRAGRIPFHHQSPGVVGVVRRHDRGPRGPHRDVAGRRLARGQASPGGVCGAAGRGAMKADSRIGGWMDSGGVTRRGFLAVATGLLTGYPPIRLSAQSPDSLPG